jgi:hypothetical protein
MWQILGSPSVLILIAINALQLVNVFYSIHLDQKLQ